MLINEKECERAKLDPKKVASIARRLSRAAQEARQLGLHVFGGSGSGSLRFNDGEPGESHLVIAHIDGPFDGGDGAEHQDQEGLWRGE